MTEEEDVCSHYVAQIKELLCRGPDQCKELLQLLRALNNFSSFLSQFQFITGS
jgi:hypothetical protein